MHLDQPGDHPALALTHGWHIDFPVILGDSEFLASPEVRRDFGAMDDILARKTRDVGARTSDIFSLDDSSLHPFAGRVQAMYLPASPLPSTRRSYSSG